MRRCRPRSAVNAWGANIGAAQWNLSLPLLDPNRAFSLIADLLGGGDDNHLFITSAGNGGQRLVQPSLVQTLFNPYFFLPAQLNLKNMLVVAASGGEGGGTACGAVGARSASNGTRLGLAGAAPQAQPLPPLQLLPGRLRVRPQSWLPPPHPPRPCRPE